MPNMAPPVFPTVIGMRKHLSLCGCRAQDQLSHLSLLNVSLFPGFELNPENNKIINQTPAGCTHFAGVYMLTGLYLGPYSHLWPLRGLYTDLTLAVYFCIYSFTLTLMDEGWMTAP